MLFLIAIFAVVAKNPNSELINVLVTFTGVILGAIIGGMCSIRGSKLSMDKEFNRQIRIHRILLGGYLRVTAGALMYYSSNPMAYMEYFKTSKYMRETLVRANVEEEEYEEIFQWLLLMEIYEDEVEKLKSKQAFQTLTYEAKKQYVAEKIVFSEDQLDRAEKILRISIKYEQL